MNVGLFCDTFPPELDGVGMVVASYARELTALQENCFLVSPKAPDGQEHAYPCPVIPYHGVRLPQAPQYRAGLPVLDNAYRRQAHKVQLDLLHAHSPFGAGVEALRLSRLHDAPLIGTFHSKYYDDFYQATGSEVIAEAGVKLIVSFYNACFEVWTVNEATAKVLHEYGYKRDIVIMPNGTDLWFPTQADRDEASALYGLGDGDVFLFVGQQNWKKNIRLSVEALALYKKERPRFKMVMVGQGPHQQEIKDLVHRLNMDEQFVFTGQLSDRNRMMGLYARADAFLFPSLYDTAGLVVREAAASGTPSVLVRNSCAAECIRENENGFLCEETPEDLCHTLIRIMENPKLRERVGTKARETIPIPWHRIMKDVQVRYQQVREEYDMREIRMEKE